MYVVQVKAGSWEVLLVLWRTGMRVGVYIWWGGEVELRGEGGLPFLFFIWVWGIQ